MASLFIVQSSIVFSLDRRSANALTADGRYDDSIDTPSWVSNRCRLLGSAMISLDFDVIELII